MNSVEENKNNQFKYLTDIVKDSKWSIKRGPFGSALKKQFFVPFGYKIYEQKHAIRNDFDIGNYYVNEEKFNELKAFELNPRDIIISCSGTVGRIAVAPDNLKKGIINQALLKISLNEKKVSITYFTYWFTDFVNEGSLKTKGAAIKNIISVKELKKIPIPIPSLEEQKRIVAKIDTLFAKIDKAITLTEKSLIQAKNLLPSVLKEVFEKGKADGWEEKKWEDVLEIKNGKSQKEFLVNEGGFPIYGSGGVMNGRVSKSLCPKNTTIIGRKGTIDKPKYIEEEFWNVDTAFGLCSNIDLSPRFLYYFCLTFNFRTLNKSTTLPSLTKRDLLQIRMPFTTSENQKKVIKIADDILLKSKQTQSKLEEQLAYLKQLKSSILSIAFKGEL